MDQTILYYGSQDFVKELGKESGETDIKYYHNKQKEDEITILFPFKYPERIQPLINSASVSKKAILEIESIDRSVGELMLVLDYYNVEKVGIVTDDETFDSLSKIIRGLHFNAFKLERNMSSYLEFLDQPLSPPKSEEVIVIVDQAFTVKGVGTVVLGFVMSGKIRKHQKLRAYPSGKEAEIRSIQIMDVDREEASPYSRIGLALKGVEVDEVQKGTLLSDNLEIEMNETLELQFYSNKAIKTQPYIGEKVQVNLGFSNVNSEVSDYDGTKILLDVDRKLPVAKGIPYSVTDLNQSPRILGVGRIGD